MKFKKTLCLIAIIAIYPHNTTYPKQIEQVIAKANSFLKKHHTIQGNFELVEDKKIYKGYFLFKKPQLFKMIFNDKKTIIFNGKNLWAYFPKMNIIINQHINKENQTINISTNSLDINYLTKHYNYFFKKGYNKLKNIKTLNEQTYILELNPKDIDYGFKKLFLYIRDDGLIVRSVGINYNDKVFMLTKKNLILNRKIDNNIFKKEVPKDAKVIKNPFTTGRNY